MGAIRLTAVCKNYLWGGTRLRDLFGRGDANADRIAESWEVSVHPDGQSRTQEGTLAEYLAQRPAAVDAKKSDFPVLIKYIDAKQNLSVQVHPDDAYARANEGDNGKTEMWYVIEAANGAGIYCGFKRDTTKEEFLQKVQDGSVEELLNFIPVRAGDCYLIEAGTVHAIGAGCVICEVQQSSNVTYRVYDYNRKDAQGNLRPLHVQKAVNVIRFTAFADATHSGQWVAVAGGKMRLLTKCAYFRCRELLLSGTYAESAEHSFTAVNVLQGNGEIDGQAFGAGDSFFVPCGERFTLSGNAKIILSDENSQG